MKNIFKSSVFIILVLLSLSCKKDKPTPPVITTTIVSDISYTSATSGGNLTNEGGAPITGRGVCWSTTSEPSIDNMKTIESGELGSFISKITQLTPNTLHYVRAYATNSAGTGYGNQLSFTTNKVAVPVLTTSIVTSIKQTTAISGGDITDDNGGNVTGRGVCWSTSVNPTIGDIKTTDGTGVGSFTSSLTGLTAGTTYYLKSYATNVAGTAYGNAISFITSVPIGPELNTTAASSITQTTATSGGNITSDGGSPITARGVCWSTSANPTIENSKTIDNTGNGAFTSSIIGLSANTTYYVRAYATNNVATAYGTQVSFITLPTVPVLTTTLVTSITQTTATSGGNITNDGGATITARGVCWSTSASPTIEDSKTTNGAGIGVFTSSIVRLSSNTTYYVRAYASNSVGPAYGNEISFTTSQNITSPTVITTPITILTSTSATVGCDVTDDGGASLSERGVYWGTSQNSESTGTKLQIGNGIGSFSTSLSSLIPNTIYYVRAYATNSAGTNYGSELKFKTLVAYDGTVTDIDLNVYNTIRIGTQVWMAENLKTTKYSNGDLIGSTSPAILDISGETIPKYQWAYNGDENNVGTYGRLYTWFATTDSRNVCPAGWHLPSDDEWHTLILYLDASAVLSLFESSSAGGDLKESGTTHWGNPNMGATNDFGFTALPCGYRYQGGDFWSINWEGMFWSSTEYSATKVWVRYLSKDNSDITRMYDDKKYAFSVRCLRD